MCGCPRRGHRVGGVRICGKAGMGSVLVCGGGGREAGEFWSVCVGGVYGCPSRERRGGGVCIGFCGKAGIASVVACGGGVVGGCSGRDGFMHTDA